MFDHVWLTFVLRYLCTPCRRVIILGGGKGAGRHMSTYDHGTVSSSKSTSILGEPDQNSGKAIASPTRQTRARAAFVR